MHPMEISPMSTGLWYMVGVLLRVIYRWARWVTKQDKQGLACWARYWKKHTAENVMQIIVSVVAMFAWTQGLVWGIAKSLGWEVPPVVISIPSSIAAGFVLSYVIHRYVASKFSPKE